MASNGRTLVDLTGDTIHELPAQCRQCLFWELGRPRPNARDVGKVHEDELAGDPVTSKAAWASAQLHDGGGAAGRVVRIADRTVGYVLFGDARTFSPRRAPAPAPSGDALLLATIWVEPAYRDAGLGRVLVQSAIKEAIRRDLKAVQVYGDRRFREADCVLPTQWLLHEGFEVSDEHPRYPLLRLDVKRTVRWTESLESALDEVLERVRGTSPAPAPGPAPVRTGSRSRATDDQSRGGSS